MYVYSLALPPICMRPPHPVTPASPLQVHVCPPRPSDFIPLAEWIRKSTLFNVLRTIQFFRRYIDVKLFRIWFKNVKYRTYLKQRSKLIKKLYLARPSFCQTLVDLNAKCFEMRKAQLVIRSKIYDLVDFVKRSDDQVPPVPVMV